MQSVAQAGLGFVFLMAGIAAWFFVGRRRFHRRNAAGIEEFNGYASMLGTRVFEKGLRILAVLLVLAGFGLMMAGVNRNQAKSPAATAKVTKASKSAISTGAEAR
jgi:hypothetical protein